MNKDRRQETTIEVIVGFFFAMMIVALFFGTAVLSRTRLFGGGNHKYEVVFDHVMGLRKGDNVFVKGVDVGKVDSLAVRPDGAHVFVSLEVPIKLHDDYKVEVLPTSVLGGRYLSFDLGSNGKPELREGAVLHGLTPVDLIDEATRTVSLIKKNLEEGKVLENLSATMADVKKISNKLAAGEGTLGKLLMEETMYADLKSTTANLKEISNRLAAGEGRPFPVPGVPDRWWLDSAGNMYLLMSAGENRIKRGQPYLDKGHRLVKLSPNLHVLWEYRNLVVGMGACWNTTIAKPGEILGTQRFTGDFGRYLTVSSYYGQYHILDKETGLYITAITPDTRSEPPLDGMAVFTENFNGWAVYAPSMKKYLFCGGDAQARVWEVHGLEDVKYARTAVTVTDADHAKAVAASKTIYGLTGVEQGEKVLMTPQLGVRVDGDLSEWAGANWAPFAVDDHRKGRAALAWTSTGLSVAFDMTDDSPLRNRGGNLNLLFKSGDALEFDISSAAADVARPDEKPVTGDKRILLSVVKDANGTERAVAMLYEPKSARADKSPGTFTSPVSTVTYDYVGQLPAQIAWQRTDTGYTLEAAFDAQALGFTGLEVGQRLRVDFGALFSDKGGAMTLAKTLWADDSPEVSIVNDIPTEAKIHPKRWGWAVLR